MVDSLCYAYNKQGQRCDQNAGPDHEDRHTFTVTWSDDENWAPGEDAERIVEQTVDQTVAALVEQALKRGPVPLPETAQALEEPVAADNPVVCFSCEHPWHDDACEAFIGKKSDGVVCGCSVAIA